MSHTPHAPFPGATGAHHVDAYGPNRQGITFVNPSSRPLSRNPTIDSRQGLITSGDEMHVTCWHDLAQPLVVRQWIHERKLYREATERIPSRFELFFDLLLVGIIHHLADHAAERGDGLGLLQFLVVFYPACSIWVDLRNFLNTSGVDDAVQRTYTLFIMLCLAGYSANASGVEVHAKGEVAEAASEVAHRFVRRAAAAAASAVGGAEATHGSHGLYDGHRLVVAAAGFFLTAKLARVLMILAYAYALPEFRMPFLLSAATITFSSLLFIGTIWAPSLITVAILVSVSIGLEIGSRYMIGVTIWLDRRKRKMHDKQKAACQAAKARAAEEQSGDDSTKGDDDDESHAISRGAAAEDAACRLLQRRRPGIDLPPIPALNLEHFIERNAGFIVIVLGETIISLLYVASEADGSVGLSQQYGRAVFGLTTAFIMNAVYFDSNLSKRFVHALRRHWLSSVTFDILHYPLGAALLVSSAAVSKMVGQEEVGRGLRWYYGGGLSVALFCMTGIGICHQSLDHAGTTRLNRTRRVILRGSVAIIFLLLPLIPEISDLRYLAIYTSVATFLILVETFGKLGVDLVPPIDHTAVKVDDLAEPVREDSQSAEQEPDTKGSISEQRPSS